MIKSARLSPLALLLCTGSLYADQTATVQVRMLGPDGRPRAGVQVRLESPERAMTLTRTTDARGQATFVGLLPGEYRLQGSQSLRLRVDERPLVILREGAEQALVEVGATALREPGSSLTSATVLDGEDLRRLPFAPSRYVEQGTLAPGVTPSGKPEPVVLGSMLDANAFLVDGMPTSLPSTGRFGINLSSEILETQRLTTGGHKAEVGQAAGGVYQMVTRSGTNAFEGSLVTRRIWRALNSDPRDGRANTPEERPTDGSAFGLTVGGPLIKDRLFFFGAFERQLLSLDYQNVRPLGGTPHRRSQEEDRSYRFAKVTWMATPDHRVEAFWAGDPVLQERFDTAGSSKLKDDQMGNRTRGGNSFQVRHVATFGAGTVWENALALHRTNFRWFPASPEAGPSRNQLDAPGGETFGQNATDRLEKSRNLSLRSEVTRFMGEHQLKAGFQGLRADFTTAYRRPSSGLAFTDRAAGGAGPAAKDLAAIRAGLQALQGTDYGYAAADSLATPSPVSGQLVGGRASFLYQRTLADLAEYGSPMRQTLAGLYAQDDWHVAAAWTLNLGLRLDRAQVDAEDGRRLYNLSLLSPRLGLQWQAAQHTRLTAYLGRIYTPPTPGALSAAGATTGGPAQQRQVWIPSLSTWKTWQATGTQGVKNVALGDLKAPRTDMAQVGASHAIPAGGDEVWMLEATFTRKWVRDLIDTYNPAWGYLPEYQAAAQASAGSRFIGNLPGLQRDYQGLDLVVRRDFAEGHRLQVSYSHGDLTGNSTVGNVASASPTSGGAASSPSLREDYRQARYDGPLNESVRHSLKAFGTLLLPGGFELSGAWTWRSGLHYSALLTVSDELVLAPGSSRGDHELPSVSALDLALAWGRRFHGVDYRLSLEAYNVFNEQPMTLVNNVGGAFTPGNHQQPRVWQAAFRARF